MATSFCILRIISYFSLVRRLAKVEALSTWHWGLAHLDMRFVDGDTHFPQSIVVQITALRVCEHGYSFPKLHEIG